MPVLPVVVVTVVVVRMTVLMRGRRGDGLRVAQGQPEVTVRPGVWVAVQTRAVTVGVWVGGQHQLTLAL
ncbi:MAG: hypothetical protein ABSG95_11220 [Solirubrobacteraceae bacterium]|jgi:hypothetical protein